jgi:Spy/CpxP family protein refolding chaperone
VNSEIDSGHPAFRHLGLFNRSFTFFEDLCQRNRSLLSLSDTLNGQLLSHARSVQDMISSADSDRASVEALRAEFHRAIGATPASSNSSNQNLIC